MAMAKEFGKNGCPRGWERCLRRCQLLLKIRECACVLMWGGVRGWVGHDLMRAAVPKRPTVLGPLIGKRRGLSSFFLHCSSNMKRAASLNYLNQPSAAPLQVRAVLGSILVGEQERGAMGPVPQELGKRRVLWVEDSSQGTGVG